MSDEEERDKNLEKARREFVEREMKKFREKMANAGVEVTQTLDGDGDAEVKRLQKEVKKEMEEEKELDALEDKIIKIKHRYEERKREADPIGHGSAGVIPLSGATGRKDLSFDSHEEMVDFLQRESASGNKRAKVILNELFHKSLSGQRAPMKEMKFKGEVDIEGKEKGLFETMREEFRKRKLAEKERRDEQNE